MNIRIDLGPNFDSYVSMGTWVIYYFYTLASFQYITIYPLCLGCYSNNNILQPYISIPEILPL